MDSKKVKLNFDKINKKKIKTEHLVYWPASQIPADPKFTLAEDPPNQNKLMTNNVMPVFESINDPSGDQFFQYFIGELQPSENEDGCPELNCRPAKLHRMFPNHTFKDLIDDENKDQENRLTQREQMDELKGKFGSKKTQRNLASKRKYEIQFGETDIDDLPSLNNQEDDQKEKGHTKDDTFKKEENEIALSSILPKRNPNAKSVDEVYSIFNDIIAEEEEKAIIEREYELFESIKNGFMKELGQTISKSDHKSRVMAIYADVLYQMIKLNSTEMKKADPLPLIVGDIKRYLFDRYTSTKQINARKLQYVITDQNKDRMLAFIFILTMALNNYKSIELDKLQSNFNLKQAHLRRILELIGCHIENLKNFTGILTKVATLRLPLFVYQEPNKIKRMRR